MPLPEPYHQEDAVTIYHGDNRQILPLLGKFDLLMADPPYGINERSKKAANQKNTMNTETLRETITESFEERWIEKGYTIESAQKAKAAYEEWAQEDIALDAIDDAILGKNVSGGLFPTRLEAFFAGWISSANAPALPHQTTTNDD